MLYNTSSRVPRRTILCIDSSPSMLDDDYPPSRFDAAKKAAVTYLLTRAQLDQRGEVAVVVYCAHARVLVPFTPLSGNLSKVVKTIMECSSEGGTDVTKGLAACEGLSFPLKETVRSFFRNIFQDDAEEIDVEIILLSDGNHLYDSDPTKVSTRLKEKGVTIETVGIGRREDVDEDLLRRIATTDPVGTIHYTFLTDERALVKHYEKLARTIVK